jgi:hypothetical protein
VEVGRGCWALTWTVIWRIRGSDHHRATQSSFRRLRSEDIHHRGATAIQGNSDWADDAGTAG